jgi:hypothetical protein
VLQIGSVKKAVKARKVLVGLALQPLAAAFTFEREIPECCGVPLKPKPKPKPNRGYQYGEKPGYLG